MTPPTPMRSREELLHAVAAGAGLPRDADRHELDARGARDERDRRARGRHDRRRKRGRGVASRRVDPGRLQPVALPASSPTATRRSARARGRGSALLRERGRARRGSVHLGGGTALSEEPLVPGGGGMRSVRDLEALWIGRFMRQVPWHERVEPAGEASGGGPRERAPPPALRPGALTSAPAGAITHIRPLERTRRWTGGRRRWHTARPGRGPAGRGRRRRRREDQDAEEDLLQRLAGAVADEERRHQGQDQRPQHGPPVVAARADQGRAADEHRSEARGTGRGRRRRRRRCR